MPAKILRGDVSGVLETFESSYFDACFCDPPYGLAEPRSPQRVSGKMNRSGFMGMEWDGEVPGPGVWAAILRVLKPGAPLLAFGGTRTFHRLACAIEDAGFILSDTLCWLHGQGFPKSHAQLKPAWEPITLAWKPGKRALNLDGCRIGNERRINQPTGRPERCYGGYSAIATATATVGRWPANLLLDPESASLLDAQSGISKSTANQHSDSGGASRFFYCAKASPKERDMGLNETASRGNAHRYDSIRTNRGAGYSEGSAAKNTHPTVKPLKLCEYLARLILPPNADAELLVPFAGSGSEVIGARRAGWRYITGIEKEAQYAAIAEKRICA